MEASCPPTSGATRTSVVRTTPTSGASWPGRHRKNSPAPVATTMSAMTIRRLAMRHPPLDEARGQHRERKIRDGEPPQAAPVVRDLGEAGAQLVHANDAVDGKIRREDTARGQRCRWDGFARPGEAGEEELRQAGGE